MSLSETVGSLKKKSFWGDSTSGEQTEVKWKGWFSQGQSETRVLQYWRW